MALSNSYAFNPALGELGLYCFNRIGIRPTELIQNHMFTLKMAANLVCGDFSNRGVNLWQVELVSQPLTAGVATYAVDPNVVLILDCYRTQGSGEETIDQILLPISRSEYASYPNKQQQGVPTVFWNDRTLSPTISLYLTPNAEWPTLNYYVVRQLMDANLANGGSVDVPSVWLKAFTDAVTLELAVSWAPDRVPMLQPIADKSYELAALQNEETSQLYISPLVGGYYRP